MEPDRRPDVVSGVAGCRAIVPGLDPAGTVSVPFAVKKYYIGREHPAIPRSAPSAVPR